MDGNRTGNLSLLTRGSLENRNDTVEWTSTTGFSLFVLLSAVVTNSSVVFLFFQNRSLLTPFTIYVLNLLLGNILRTLTCFPLELVNNLYHVWWTGWTSCTVYLYGTWVVEAAMCNAHMLIALNRLWAIAFPHSYRTKHTTRFAICTCLAMWLYVHAGLLPEVIMDALWYRKPLGTDGCLVNTNAQMTWSYATQAPFYAFPYALVVVVYIVVCFKLYQTSRSSVGPVLKSRTSRGSNLKTNERSSPHRSRTKREERKNSAFLTMTLMTFSLIVLYGPSLLFYMAAIYSDWEIPGLYPVASVLYELMAVLDPLLFALVIADLRRAFRQVYCCGH